MVDGNIEDRIKSLYTERKWEEIANLNCTAKDVKRSRLFWVLPTVSDLHWMDVILKAYNMYGLVSIGCGCGLFEWLFQNYSGLDVIGLELDKSWWCSKYSPPIFLENIIFIQESETRSFRASDNYALLFCYFNNADAFCSYINNYKGNLVFVIGPCDGQNRSCDPLPLDAKFVHFGWELIAKKEIDRSRDQIAAYIRRSTTLVS